MTPTPEFYIVKCVRLNGCVGLRVATTQTLFAAVCDRARAFSVRTHVIRPIHSLTSWLARTWSSQKYVPNRYIMYLMHMHVTRSRPYAIVLINLHLAFWFSSTTPGMTPLILSPALISRCARRAYIRYATPTLHSHAWTAHQHRERRTTCGVRYSSALRVRLAFVVGQCFAYDGLAVMCIITKLQIVFNIKPSAQAKSKPSEGKPT